MKYASSIEFNEKNVKAVQPGITELDTTVGMLLKANFGPSNVLTKITSEADLVEKFGYPTEYNYLDWFNAAGYLKYSSPLYVVRPLSSTSESNASIVFENSEDIGSGSSTGMYNEEVAFETLDGIDITDVDIASTLTFYNRWASNLNDIAIQLCTSETEWSESISKRDIFDETIALESTIYTRATLPTLNGTNFANKDKVAVVKPTFDSGEIIEMEYHIYYANYTSETSGTWVEWTDDNGDAVTLTDDDRIFVTSKNLAYVFDHTFTSATAFDNYLTDVTEDIYASEEALPDETDYEYNDRVIVRTNGTPDVFTVWYNNEGTWTTTGTTLANGDKIFEITSHSYYDLAIGVVGAGLDTLTFTPDAVSEITNEDSMTQDTDITVADEVLIKRDANKIITNSVVRYLDSTLYNKTDYSPLTYESLLPNKPDFTKNEVGVVVLKKNRDGWFEVKESYVHSLTSTAIKTNGKSNFLEDNINKYSKLVYCKSAGCVNTSTFIPSESNSVFYCTIEDAGSDRSNLTDYTILYNSSSSVFGKNGYFHPEILIGYDCGDTNLNSGYLDAMPLIAKETGMSLAVVGMSRATIGQTESDTNDEIIENLGNRRVNATYGGLTEFNTYTFSIGTMKKFYDQYNDKYRWVSVAGDVSGMMARNDTMFGPQSAVAGYVRGKFSNYSKMLYEARIGQDELSRNGINAIVRDVEDRDYYLFEYLTNTTLDELTKEANIRRMVIRIKHLLNIILKGNYFEFNNRETRDRTLFKIKGIFEKFKKNGGLYDYKLICDETNNTSERINANEFVLDIRLQPNRLIKHIIVNIVNYDMGINIQEL